MYFCVLCVFHLQALARFFAFFLFHVRFTFQFLCSLLLNFFGTVWLSAFFHDAFLKM